MSKAKPREVPENHLADLVAGEENRAIRTYIAKFMAARRRCQVTGYGRVALVSEFHAQRVTNALEIGEKEAE